MDFDSLWDYDHPAETEIKFRALLPAVDPGSAAHVELLTQIARTQGLQRQFDLAHRTLDDARAQLTDAMPCAQVRYWLERGRVFNSAQRREEALPCFTQALALAQVTGEDGYAVDAAHMLAIAEADPAQQLTWNLHALTLAEASAQPAARQWLGSLYNNLGWTYHDSGQYAQALDLFKRALRWRETQGQARPLHIARWCVARTLRSLGRVAEALALQAALAQTGDDDGYVAEELGECLLALNRPTEAQPHFARAYALLAQDPWLAENDPQRLKRLAALGEAMR